MVILNAAAKGRVLEKSYKSREFSEEVERQRGFILDTLERVYGNRAFTLTQATAQIKKLKSWSGPHARDLVRVALIDGIHLRCIKRDIDGYWWVVDLRDTPEIEIVRADPTPKPLRLYWRRNRETSQVTLWAAVADKVKTVTVGEEDFKTFRLIANELDLPMAETLQYEVELKSLDLKHYKEEIYNPLSKKNIEYYIEEYVKDGGVTKTEVKAVVDDDPIIDDDAIPV